MYRIRIAKTGVRLSHGPLSTAGRLYNSGFNSQLVHKALAVGQAERGIANGDDMVQNISEDMEPQEKDTRHPESGNQMWSGSPSSEKKSNA